MTGQGWFTCVDGKVMAMALRQVPSWGTNYGSGEVAYVTPEGVTVWMHRKGQKVRYFDSHAQQVGPEHANVAPAVVWAAMNGWVDPANPDLSVACILEVRGQHR